MSCECDLCRLSSVETGKHLFSQQLSFKERDAVLFRCHQGSQGTLRSLQSESYAAVKGGRGGLGGGFTRSDDVEVKIRNKTMMLIMQKQQSGGIKQPITPAGRRSRRDFPSVRETCRRCRGIDRQSTDLIVNQDRRANREINSLSAINRATAALVTSPATELKCAGWWTEYVEVIHPNFLFANLLRENLWNDSQTVRTMFLPSRF